jgi:hypothetical protein
MRVCTQPGCTGRIVDGYCDVCGGPAGAAPFVHARSAASAVSPASAVEAGLAAVVGGSGAASARPSDGLMSACTQPGCTGRIVDGYCDVCGSPADAAPFVPAESAASAASPAPADEPGLAAVPASIPPPAPVSERIPIQRIPRAKMPTQQSSAQELADQGAADPGVVDPQNVDPAADDTGKVAGERELAKDEPNGAQEYRTRVEEATLPDDVREAALCEVGKLERTSAQSPESGDIRTWLDTILNLPWSTKITDSIDIHGSPEVEATLRRLIEPAAADVEEAETVEVEPAVADIGKADTAPAGPQHDGTVKMPGVPAVLSGGRHQPPQLPEQRVLGPEPVQTPAKKRRIGSLALAATVLAALLIGALLFATRRDGGVTAQSVPAVTATATVSKPTSEPSNQSTDTRGARPTIQLENLANTASPFQPVRIQGTYRGGPDTFLQVQRWERGEWLSFPLPTKTDQSGQFTAYVELGPPGRYRLRVLDPDSDVRSKTFVVVIEG